MISAAPAHQTRCGGRCREYEVLISWAWLGWDGLGWDGLGDVLATADVSLDITQPGGNALQWSSSWPERVWNGDMGFVEAVFVGLLLLYMATKGPRRL